MKKNNIIKILTISVLVTVVSSFAGCSENNNTSSDNTESSVPSSAASKTDENSEISAENSMEVSIQENSESNSVPELSDPTPEADGETINGIFVYNNAAFELFYGDEDMAKNYADTISGIKKSLGDDIKVYNVLVPTHIGVGLPDKFSDISNSQEDYLNTICNSYSDDIISVNAFDTLMRHRNEYLYFNTDHHWTALAAYYAYTDFTDKAGIDAIPLESMEKNEITDYFGSLTNDDEIAAYLTIPDTVVYYKTDADIECMQYDENAENPTETMLLHEYAEGVNSYGVFLGGDNALTVAKNENGNGKKIAVVKESYGNAFAPFIAFTYSETHIIDFRYFNADLKQYLKDNEITDVIFINNSMASATSIRCDELASLVKS